MLIPTHQCPARDHVAKWLVSRPLLQPDRFLYIFPISRGMFTSLRSRQLIYNHRLRWRPCYDHASLSAAATRISRFEWIERLDWYRQRKLVTRTYQIGGSELILKYQGWNTWWFRDRARLVWRCSIRCEHHLHSSYVVLSELYDPLTYHV